LEEQTVDVVVVDLQMPQMNGLSFLEQVAEKFPLSGRIVLSAYVQEGSLERAMVEDFAQQILSKPWDDEAVKTAIRTALGE
jgi:CheY-like chemotaxis protein